jgi:uncharacterized protein YkwD
VPNKASIAVLATLAATLLAPAAQADAARRNPVARAAAACANADLRPTRENVRQVRAAVLCLHNELREAQGLPRLRDNVKLRRAARSHAEDMVASRFFAHTTPGGVSMTDRIRRAGYMRSAGYWSIGENLAWGTGSFGTPRGAVQAWMNSTGHRANLLNPRFRHAGVGVAIGTPSSGGGGATFTVDFGVRR